MEINKTTWDSFFEDISDERWETDGPVFGEMELRKSPSTFDTLFEDPQELAAKGIYPLNLSNIVPLCGKVKFDLKSNDVKRERRIEGERKWWQCRYVFGVEYRPHVIYLRIANDKEADPS